MKVWILVFVINLLSSSMGHDRCLNTSTHRKIFYTFNDETKPLTIDSSDGITHNITSNIFKIYLEEELGYGDVSIVINNTRNASLVRISELGIFAPDTLINMEVWMFPNDVIGRKLSAWNMGIAISRGRFGWFSSKNGLCWKDFTQSNSSTRFELPPDIYNKATEIAAKKAAEIAASEHDDLQNCRNCTNGTYIPIRCTVQNCSILLSGDYKTADQLTKEIESYQLNVIVIWLGTNLPRIMDSLPKEWPLLALTWFPSEVSIRRDKWYPVTFPPCPEKRNCIHESRRVMKVASDRVRVGAPLAFKTLGEAYFSIADYNFMLRSSLNNSLTHREIACEWMKKNKHRWRFWQTAPETTKPRLLICGILPLNGTMRETGLGIQRAIELAAKRIDLNDQVLPHYNLTIKIHDGGCTSENVMNTFINYVLESSARDLVGIVGPACSETVEPLIKLTKYFRTVVISYSAEGSTFSDKEEYPNFFRTIGANRRYKDVYFELFQQMGWKRMVALTEEGPKYAEYLSELESIQSNKFKLIYQKKLPRERNNRTIRSKLEGFRADNARIIVADIHDNSARAIMCEAYKQRMTAAEGYVWFLPQWLSKGWYLTAHRNITEATNCTDTDMLTAIEGHFSLAHRYFAPDDVITHENKTVADWKADYKHFIEDKNKKQFATESKYAGFAYDAVWTYAYALHNLNAANESYLSDIHSLDANKMFVKIINNTDFMGVSGRITFNRSEPSRPTVINLLQWSSKYQKYLEVGYMEEEPPLNSSIHTASLHVDFTKIQWFTKDGKPPTDGGDLCALQSLADFLNIDCVWAIIIVSALCVLLLAAVLIPFAFYLYNGRKKMKEYRKAHDYMRSIGFETCPTDNIVEMERWEVPRDCVVINRRLGEGAFGMVYGGEILLDRDSRGWTPAAVKTLKEDADGERRIEFLAEAEMMKKFDHQNIVQLLGVCTTDPLYTIMEFMLHGDLKTYLLNRRHLVKSDPLQVSEEANDVSARKLTDMALGIARGLSYLTSINYVHRDLAARNCLVSHARIVKIGDFGMTRPMYDSDYYKFSRKGMLPVRWMARESLVDGIFTPASDVWSLGVVFYEIITFGSYPFPGMSNTQVVEHVRAGKVVKLPKGVNSALETVIKSCWKQDPKKRPEASALVKFLAESPDIISPCLSEIANSVAVDDSDGLGIQLGLRRSAPTSPHEFGHNLFRGEGPVELSNRGDDIIRRSGSPFQDTAQFSSDPSAETLLAGPSRIRFALSRISSRSGSEESLTSLENDSKL